MSKKVNTALVNGALRQDRLNLLLAVYDARLVDVAAAAGMSNTTASDLINAQRTATTEQILRIEAAIVGVGRLAAKESQP